MKTISLEVYKIHEKMPEYECENVLIFTTNFTNAVDAFFQDGRFWVDDELDCFFNEETILGWSYYPKY